MRRTSTDAIPRVAIARVATTTTIGGAAASAAILDDVCAMTLGRVHDRESGFFYCVGRAAAGEERVALADHSVSEKRKL